MQFPSAYAAPQHSTQECSASPLFCFKFGSHLQCASAHASSQSLTALLLQQLTSTQRCSACPLSAQTHACTCSVLQRMLRRNPLAALSLQQPSLRTPSLQLADDMPFELDKEGDADSPDGMCMHHLNVALRPSLYIELVRYSWHNLMLCYCTIHMHHRLLLQNCSEAWRRASLASVQLPLSRVIRLMLMLCRFRLS